GWLTDECLARYVRARKGVYEDTKKALRKTIEWRATARPHALRPDVVEIENRTGKMYFNGFDKFSRPIIYMYNHRQNTKEADNQIRWVIYTLEMCIRNMPPGVEKVTLAIDATHWGFSNAVSIGIAKKFLDILGNHYPERLGRAVVFMPPKFFVAFYSLVSSFIDPVTKAKVAFVSPSSPPDAQAQQADNNSSSPWISADECFNVDMLEADCYGNWKFQYNHAVYWSAI
ncbi:CRAL-TRIO domain-containing protein, partial [Kickxella alabastrina]|uniref:CRAL-TRIO domain-containing protein n=1 Tax=Kickxella alabastrina TaxID=61397 RepID=UPI0022208F30